MQHDFYRDAPAGERVCCRACENVTTRGLLQVLAKDGCAMRTRLAHASLAAQNEEMYGEGGLVAALGAALERAVEAALAATRGSRKARGGPVVLDVDRCPHCVIMPVLAAQHLRNEESAHALYRQLLGPTRKRASLCPVEQDVAGGGPVFFVVPGGAADKHAGAALLGTCAPALWRIFVVTRGAACGRDPASVNAALLSLRDTRASVDATPRATFSALQGDTALMGLGRGASAQVKERAAAGEIQLFAAVVEVRDEATAASLLAHVRTKAEAPGRAGGAEADAAAGDARGLPAAAFAEAMAGVREAAGEGAASMLAVLQTLSDADSAAMKLTREQLRQLTEAEKRAAGSDVHASCGGRSGTALSATGFCSPGVRTYVTRGSGMAVPHDPDEAVGRATYVYHAPRATTHTGRKGWDAAAGVRQIHLDRKALGALLEAGRKADAEAGEKLALQQYVGGIRSRLHVIGGLHELGLESPLVAGARTYLRAAVKAAIRVDGPGPTPTIEAVAVQLAHGHGAYVNFFSCGAHVDGNRHRAFETIIARAADGATRPPAASSRNVHVGSTLLPAYNLMLHHAPASHIIHADLGVDVAGGLWRTHVTFGLGLASTLAGVDIRAWMPLFISGP